MKMQFDKSTRRIINGALVVLVIGSVASLFALANSVNPSNPFEVPHFKLVLILILILGILAILKGVPLPGPNPRRLTIDVGTDPAIRVFDINGLMPDSREPQTAGNQNYAGSVGLSYYSHSPATERNMASISGPANEIIGTAGQVSVGKSVTFDNVMYYQTNIVFQLKNRLDSPSLKVTIPDELFIPKGRKEFTITVE